VKASKIASKFIDLGCGNGRFTLKCARKLRSDIVLGVDLDKKDAYDAKNAGIDTIRCDLNSSLPFKDDSFNVVLSNQVIEHLDNVDLFVEEICRILVKGGYAIISTENLSSWHNVFALVLGYRPFSQDYSCRIKIGNPLSPHDKEAMTEDSRCHIRIFTYQTLLDLFKFYGFEIEKIMGAGYYPFGSRFFMRLLSRIDPRHTHFLTLKIRKREGLHLKHPRSTNT